MRILINVIIIVFSITSCDVPGLIEIDNTSGEEVLFLMLKEEQGELDTIKLIVPDEQKRKIILGFGTNWTDHGIKYFLSSVNSIQVSSSNDTLLMTNKKEMYTYFRERRKGVSKKKIEIKIE